jgi:hypothetical protein
MGNSADDAQEAIADIMARQMQSAQNSAYDWKVCVGAVSAAAAAFRAIPVGGAQKDYVGTVIGRLTALRDSYNDPEGEYTNGASDIGSAVAAIERYARTLG